MKANQSGTFGLRATPWFGCILAALVLGAPFAAAQPKLHPPDPLRRIEVTARPFDGFAVRDSARKQFGALTFRGGLVLSSPDRHFGGFSGLRIDPDGRRILAVTDRGQWLRATLQYRGAAPVALTDAEMAPILGPDGKPLAARGWFDAEAIARDGDTLYVGIERVNRIVAFDYGRHGLRARGRPVPVPAEVRKWPRQQSLECLAVPPKGTPHAGTLIAISERALDAASNLRGSTIGKKPFSFSVRRTDDFSVTDCAVSPQGSLLILERSFAWTRGVAMRIRQLSLADLRPGALLDGPELMVADMGYQIDNMEGLALHREGDGALVLTVISDDNFWAIQRTLLLQFTWKEPDGAKSKTAGQTRP